MFCPGTRLGKRGTLDAYLVPELSMGPPTHLLARNDARRGRILAQVLNFVSALQRKQRPRVPHWQTQFAQR
jgi:hypothetical protein